MNSQNNIVVYHAYVYTLRTPPEPTNPGRLNPDYLSNKDFASPPLYDDVYQGRPKNSIYQYIDDQYIHPINSYQGKDI